MLPGDLHYTVAEFFASTARYEAAVSMLETARQWYDVSSQSMECAKVDYKIAQVSPKKPATSFVTLCLS